MKKKRVIIQREKGSGTLSVVKGKIEIKIIEGDNKNDKKSGNKS